MLQQSSGRHMYTETRMICINQGASLPLTLEKRASLRKVNFFHKSSCTPYITMTVWFA
jgi:hypothetical protein